MKKAISLFLIITTVLSAVNVYSAGIAWNTENISKGEVTAIVHGADDKGKAFAASFSDGVMTNIVSGSDRVTVHVKNGEEIRTYLWNKESMEPLECISSVVTSYGVKDENTVFSDNQQSNKESAAKGYRSIDKLTGEYMIKMDITPLTKGDNAIMLGDSTNGTLGYASSSAILLFNGDNFTVRSGNGSGSYLQNAVTLCPVEVNETYNVIFWGNTSNNTYKVIITKGNERYISDTMSARKNASAIDTFALVSNGKNTAEKNGYLSGYSFVGQNVEIITDKNEMILNPLYKYDGFAGIYYALKADGKYVRGNNGKLSCDYSYVKDESAMFLPRDMGDGSYALMCRSSNNRMTLSMGLSDRIASQEYNTADNSQHWILEKSENYSENNMSYYIKHKEENVYIGKNLRTGNLTAVSESDKLEIIFEPLYDESPLYKASCTSAYNLLTDAKRKRLESVYESVAGDIFGRYGSNKEWTMRIRMDNLFNDILSGKLAESEQIAKLNDFLSSSNGYIYHDQSSYENVSASLPDTEGLFLESDDGKEGTYDFWRGSNLAGVLYKLTIKNSEGEIQQTLNLYVQNDSIAKKNAETFKKIIVQIPYIFRKNLKNVKVRKDSANSFNGGGSDLYIRLTWSPDVNNMRSTVIHELGHIIDANNGYWSLGAGWANAMEKDMYGTSSYGFTSAAEDFAEFSRMYFTCYKHPDMQKGLEIIMPERYASFGRLRKNNLGGWGLWEDEYTNG